MWTFPWVQHVLRGFDLASNTSPHFAESCDCPGGCLLPVLQWLGNRARPEGFFRVCLLENIVKEVLMLL